MIMMTNFTQAVTQILIKPIEDLWTVELIMLQYDVWYDV